MTTATIDGVSVPKLDATNYSRWVVKIKNLLEAKDLDGIVYGSEYGLLSSEIAMLSVTPDESNKAKVDEAKAKANRYKIMDAQARTVIGGGLDDKHMDIVANCHLLVTCGSGYVRSTSTEAQPIYRCS